MDKLKSAIKDKGGENLDGMIQRANSPFTNEVLNRPLPPKFRLPQLESYDGSKDPLDHIESFKMLMLLQMTPNEVMCRAFLTTLNETTRVWFGKIPLKTIADFEQLSKDFVCHFIGGVRLNLINHFVGFIPCQFACNSAFRSPIFRWESCKGNV